MSITFFIRVHYLQIKFISDGDEYETDDRCADFDAIVSKLHPVRSATSVRDSCTQTDAAADDHRRPYPSPVEFSSVSVQTDKSVGESVGVQTDFSRVDESVGVQTDPVVQSAVVVQTDTLYCQTAGVQTSFVQQMDSSEIDDWSSNEEYSPNLGMFSHTFVITTSNHSRLFFLTIHC